MLNNPPRVWVLTDDKPGNSTQSLGVAAQLPWPFEEKNITLNKAARLPNRVLGKTKISAASHEISEPWPDIAIAAGRRLVPMLRYIKKQNPPCFIAYMMRPETSLKGFDLVAIPAHDSPKPAPNVMETLGAPHRVTPELLAKAANEWQESLSHLPHPRIAVLAGGDSASALFSPQDFHELGSLASEMAEGLSGSLMVSTSRRTNQKQADYLRLSLTADSEFFVWKRNAPNPYHAFLALADVIIVTGDSMSMCAEACGTGKPVYIYVPRQGSLAPKLGKLHESLVRKGLARYLSANARHDWKPKEILNEAGRIAAEIIERYENFMKL